MSDEQKDKPPSIWDAILEVPLALLDDIGTTVKLTGETVMWSVRPATTNASAVTFVRSALCPATSTVPG